MMMSKKSRPSRKTQKPPTTPVLAAEHGFASATPTILTSTHHLPMLRHPLLVASLGNPGRTYSNTRHNAGHILLTALATHLSYPPFTSSRPHAGGLISVGLDATLWQCPTLMNVSGPAVVTAWRRFLRDLPDLDGQKRARLVVVHDELESPLGKITIKKGGSTKGHNGLKSIVNKMQGQEFWRLSVGIGRPASRESGDVAHYVLRHMTMGEREELTKAFEEAARELLKLRDDK